MLTEVCLYLLLHVTGAITCNLFMCRSRNDFALWTGFIWGLLLWVLIGIIMVITGLNISVRNYLLFYGLVSLIAFLLGVSNKKFTKHNILILLSSTLCFLISLIILFFIIKPYPVLSGDSNYFIISAKKIAEDQSLINYISIAHGPYTFLIQYLSNILNVLQIPYIMLALATSFSAGFSYITYVAIRKQVGSKQSALILSLLALIFLWSIPQMRYMACYFHTNFPVAVYFFFFLTATWLYQYENDSCWLYISSISLLACCLIRYDAFVVCFPFLILAAYNMRVEQFKKFKWIVLPTLLFICLWAFKLYSYELYDTLLANKSRLRPIYLSFYISSLLFVFIFYAILAKLKEPQKLIIHIPLFSVFCTIVVGIILFSIKPAGMVDQFLILANIMTFEGTDWWKSFWLWAIAFWILLWWPKNESDSAVFAYGIPISLCLLFFLSFPLLHFTFFQNISANRMLTKFVPVILFWVTVQACGKTQMMQKEQTKVTGLSPVISVTIIIVTIGLFFFIPNLRIKNYINNGQLIWAPQEIKIELKKMLDNNPSTVFSVEPNKTVAFIYDLKKQVTPSCFVISEETNYYFNNQQGNNNMTHYTIMVSNDKKVYTSAYDSLLEKNSTRKHVGSTTIIPFTGKRPFRYFKFIYRKSENSTPQGITELSILNRKPFIYPFL